MTELDITCLELTLPTPEENLACDEALLDWAESNESPGLLRFWESCRPFVVLGYANRVAQEVHVDACRAEGIPILRRCSGGGTILQGPGCVNYALILAMDSSFQSGCCGPLVGISGANRFIMERHRDALTGLLGRNVSIEGHTDLAIAGRKFSGNAQRRKRTHLLFHGSFLLEFDLALVGRFLRSPSREPEYRQGRGHHDFLTCLEVCRDVLQNGLQKAWNAQAATSELKGMRAATAQLAAEKYSRTEWNLKW